MCYESTEAAIASISKETACRYEKYFDLLRPTTKEEIFRRGLFALASVHTSWELNVALYAELHNLAWLQNEDELAKRIINSKAGLLNTRLKAFMLFTSVFWQFPDVINRKQNEAWHEYRDRMSILFYGLGPAKAAFFIELMHFQASRIACFDTHLLQLYGIAPKNVGRVKGAELARMEQHWDMACRAAGLNPVTARWILWDKKQGKPDSRYWSYVIERDYKPETAPEQMDLFTGV
jgi:thermostable 8-oxoguanine DNA glycosylase